MPQPPPDGTVSQLLWTWNLNRKEGIPAPVLPPVSTRAKQIFLFDNIVEDFKWAIRGGGCPNLIGPRCNYSLVGVKEGLDLEGVDAVITAFDSGHLQTTVPIPESTAHIFVLFESNYHATAVLRRQNDLLVSYNTKVAQIPSPYGLWVKYGEAKKSEKDYAVGKSKMAAIFVSNCASPNRRLEFVKELQEFIPVDVYGACGSLSCTRLEEHKCFTILAKEYKFYLALENSNCREYITEKLFRNAFT